MDIPVDEYVAAYREQQATKKTLQDQTKRCSKLRTQIIKAMKEQQVTSYATPHGTFTLVRQQGSKPHTPETLRETLRGDEATIADILSSVFDKRPSSTKESLAFTSG